MTGPVGGGEPGPRSEPDERPAGPLGSSTFTIEGRAAPGLFVVGWLATIMGGGILVAGLFAAGGAAGLGLALGGLVLLAIGLIAGAGAQGIERRARGMPGYVGPSPWLVFAAVIPVTVLLQVAVAVPLQVSGLDSSSPLATLLGLLVTAVAYLGLVRLLVVGAGAMSWTEMGVRPARVERLTEFAIGGLMGFPLIVLTGILAVVLGSFLAVPQGPLPASGGLAGGLVNLLSAAVVAPIAEETFFRGFATTAWLRSVGPTGAIIRGAIFFAAAHILTIGGATFVEGAEHAAFAFLARLPVALALGWLFVRSRSLYATVGLHAVFNGLPVLALLFTGG